MLHVRKASMKIFLIGWTCISLLSTYSSASAQDIYGAPDEPLVAEVMGTKIHSADPDEMKYVILGKLMDRYAADRDIDVKPAEIDAYLKSLQRVAERDRKHYEDRRQAIAQELKAPSLTEAERRSLSSELAAVTEHLNIVDEMTKSAEMNPDEVRQTRELVAAAFIRQWKINRALYKQYGGRVIFQQGGPEPLDAYRLFLQGQQEKGAFTILDEAFKQKFWDYYLTDSKHSFYPAGSREEEQVFDIPWWLRESQAEP